MHMEETFGHKLSCRPHSREVVMVPLEHLGRYVQPRNMARNHRLAQIMWLRRGLQRGISAIFQRNFRAAKASEVSESRRVLETLGDFGRRPKDIFNFFCISNMLRCVSATRLRVVCVTAQQQGS